MPSLSLIWLIVLKRKRRPKGRAFSKYMHFTPQVSFCQNVKMRG
jgi:hypothetical protein